MNRENRIRLVYDAGAALANARSADDVRQVWAAFYRQLGHRVLGRLLLNKATGEGGQVDDERGAQSKEIAEELATFASWSRAFALEELFHFSDSELDRETLYRAVLADTRFIRLGAESEKGFLFASKRAVLRWLVGVNLRLALAGQARMTQGGLARLLGSLHPTQQWKVLPRELVEIGEAVGLCGRARSSGEHVFPMAKIISAMPPSLSRQAGKVLRSFADTQTLPREESVVQTLHKELGKLPPRLVQIVLAREGVLTGERTTLERVAAQLGLTRERVRQLEAKFYEKLYRLGGGRVLQSLITLLLTTVALNRGSLLLDLSLPNGVLVAFAAKCLGIPQAKLHFANSTILGHQPQALAAIDYGSRFPDNIDKHHIVERIEAAGTLCLIDRDVERLAQVLEGGHFGALTKAQRVYLALRHIGKPAHYSTVAEAYNSLFPHEPSNEKSIHAVLGREQNGIVWIGLRGTYALAEWGYERPTKGLYEAVAEIVRQRHATTGKPVSFTTIAAEIGKYRPVVNRNSVVIATQCNPHLREVGNNAFVPKAPGEATEDDTVAGRLDKLLRSFERKVKMAVSVSDQPGDA
ncbi:MAG: sigma factor-like helix-turn-helix DNA-binding protein [Bacillota bacterium]|nr:sigma factor-like helix-turn-helix DNA-binding protein [Bacillota bacterium]